MLNFVKRHPIWTVIIIIAVAIPIWLLFEDNFILTSDNMSLTYSRSVGVTEYQNEGRSYVYDGDLYYIDDTEYIEEKNSRADTIQYTKNNFISTYCTPEYPDIYNGDIYNFLIIDSDLAIVEIGGKRSPNLLLYNCKSNEFTPMWDGKCVAYYNGKVYFTNENSLYAGEIDNGESSVIESFDTLFGSYYDGIVYEKDSKTYQLLFEDTSSPCVLVDGIIEWPIIKSDDFIHDTYLYTFDYALHIGGSAIDMYTYKTREIKRIFETDKSDEVRMAATARGNDIYVSRQVTGNYYPEDGLAFVDINGTYHYDIESGEWTKISNYRCSSLVLYDEKCLYGYKNYWFFYNMVRIPIYYKHII